MTSALGKQGVLSSACCSADLVGRVSQRMDVEVIRDDDEGSAVTLKPSMSVVQPVRVD